MRVHFSVDTAGIKSQATARADVNMTDHSAESDNGTSMAQFARNDARHTSLWPLPKTGEAILLLLEPLNPDWDEVAEHVRRDPAMLLAIFSALPLKRERLKNELSSAISGRLNVLGADLLRAWLLQAGWSGHGDHGSNNARVSHAVLIAECALHLAHETRYPFPDEAYLAGLLKSLTVPLHADAGALNERTSSRQAPRNPWADIAAHCGFAMPLLDALASPHMREEEFAAAHPLLRVLATATLLARENWEAEPNLLIRLSGLPLEMLLSLRTDVGFLSGTTTSATQIAPPQIPAPPATINPADPSKNASAGENALLNASLMALVRNAFSGLEPDHAQERLSIASALLCNQPTPLIVCADEAGLLVAMPLCDDSELRACCNELALRLDDETSLIALAARSNTTTSTESTTAPARSPRDWHVARWLGRTGITCLPLKLADTSGVAVLGSHPGESLSPRTRFLLVELCSAAAGNLIKHQKQKSAETDLTKNIERHFRDHARKIAHETRNPLSVIKNYLSIMALRNPDANGLRGELNILHGELDRIAGMLERAGNPPAAEPEAASCQVSVLLNDIRSVYGEALFEGRGIKFELRTTAGLPAAAIPPSALKQVLLNLFRNASEALQPGGRFAVTVPGQVVSNGNPCLEIRLIDNGPGLPLDRLSDLFSPRPSSKGDVHQGIGLSIVKETLQEWNGIILCRSQAGAGTSFQILLPLDKKS